MSDRFTDEDLQAIKTFGTVDLERWVRQEKKIGTFEALISRLEAAEKVCIGVQKVCEAHSLKGQAVIDLKAWREACGK